MVMSRCSQSRRRPGRRLARAVGRGEPGAMAPDPLQLAVRENATWCDLVCRSHRLRPDADARMWWSDRGTPSLSPDAVTLDPTVGEFDVLGRIHDAPGASVKDSFAALDLEPDGYHVLFDATWFVRPPGSTPAEADDGFERVTDKFTFGAWRYAWGGPDDVLLPGLLRTSAVTILGARTPDERYDRGGILHRTSIGGAQVVGLSNTFGPVAKVALAATAHSADAWIVGYDSAEVVAGLGALGFVGCGPLRVWVRD